jgi:ATP-binding cassette, subfamily B, bacterial
MSIASCLWPTREPQTEAKKGVRLRVYRRILQQVRPCWPHLAGIIGLGLLSIPLNLLLPLPLKIVVDSVLGQRPLPRELAAIVPSGGPATMLAVAAGLLLGVGLLMQAQALASWLLQTWTGEKMVLDFRTKLFWQSQRLSLTYHEKSGSTNTAYRIQHDAPAIQYVTIQGMVPFVGAAISFVTMVYVTAAIDWQLAAVAVVLAPVLVTLARKASLHAHESWHEVKELDSSAMSVLEEVLSSVRLVKAFGREKREDERFVTRSTERMRGQMRLARMQAGYHTAIALLITIGTAAALLIGANHVRAGILSLGELLLVMSYMTQLYEPLRTISGKIPELQAWAVSVERAFALLDQTPEALETPGARPLHRSRGALRFENVSFAYPNGRKVLNDISFDIPAGARVGIVGRTGSGKSTMVSLLTRFYDVSSGRILLDGIDIREYRLADLRNQFAIVLQDPVLFSTSVADNIAFTKPNATMAEIEAAAQAAGVPRFVDKLPKGYNTDVGERGALLSGGQRQRISVARAFLKDAPILILDEPTSAVDTQTEAQMMESTAELMRGRTAFMIAHRLSTLRECDMILVVENGDVRVISRVRKLGPSCSTPRSRIWRPTRKDAESVLATL